jgi:hypothetical protein
MAAYTGDLTYSARGYNDSNVAYTTHELVQVLANTDTLSLSLPDTVDPLEMVPAGIVCWTAADPRLPNAAFGMTSYTQSTGVLLITATGAVPDNSTFVITWVPAKVGS